MDFSAQIDNYCERLGPGFWGEPINAITNLAFFMAAIYVFPRVRDDRGAVVLVVVLMMIGLGSGLFHTLATGWASLADSLSILFFILIYLFLATQRVLKRDRAIALLAVVAFIPYAIVVERVINAMFGSLNGSVAYLPVLILMVIYGALAKEAEARSGLWVGAGILGVSLFFRSIDEAVCSSLPFGTHFLWHILNAVVLGWLILALHRIRPQS